MKRAWLFFASALLLPAGPASPQEQGFRQFNFVQTDNTLVQGSLATPTLSVETDLGTLTAASRRITGARKMGDAWVVHLGNERLVGRLITEFLTVKSASGPIEIRTSQLVSIDPQHGVARGDWPPAAEVQPLKTLLEMKPISNLQLSRDGKHLYFLETTRSATFLRALDTERDQVVGPGLELPKGVNAYRISTDDKSLILFGVSRPAAEPISKIVILNAPDLSTRAEFTVEYSISDLHPHPKGVLLAAGWGPKAESLAVIDPAVPGVVALWNPGFGPSTLQLFSDGRRALAVPQQYNQCVELSIPEDPAKTAPGTWTFPRPRGESGVTLTPDEKHFVWQSGTVTRAGPLGQGFPEVNQTARHSTALSAPGSGLLLLPQIDGTVARFSPPEFKPLRPIPVGYPWHAAAIDPVRKVIYAATDRRDRVLVGAGQPNGNLCTFDLGPLLVADTEPEKKAAKVPSGELLNPLATQPVAAFIRAIAAHGSPARFLALDGTENVLRSYQAATGEALGVSRRFPHPARILIVDGDRNAAHVFGVGPADAPGTGRWYQVELSTLAVRSEATLDFVPFDADLDSDGRVYVTQDRGARSEVRIFDPAGQTAIARWSLESEQPRIRISRASRMLYVDPPLSACPIPTGESLAKPVLTRSPAPVAGLSGPRFQLDAAGRMLLFESGAVLSARPSSPADLRFAGTLPPFRSAVFLEGRKRAALADSDGRLRIVSLADLSVVKDYRTDQLLHALCFDSASGVLAAASEGAPLSGSGTQTRVGPLLFYKVPE